MTNAEERPVAEPDVTTQEWWDATRERELCVQRCEDCGHAQHYPRPLCVSCGGVNLALDPVSGSGVIETFTIVHRAPSPAFQAPYVVALVRLAEGPRLLTNIVGCAPESVHCEQTVVVCWEALSDGRNLPVFAPD